MFFFFKQKTAYEMRISDWSSDVCSSDLRRQYAVTPEGRHQRQTGLVVARLAHAMRKRLMDGGPVAAPQPVVVVEVRIALGACRARTMAQIGRASCRERVCQYV